MRPYEESSPPVATHRSGRYLVPARSSAPGWLLLVACGACSKHGGAPGHRSDPERRVAEFIVESAPPMTHQLGTVFGDRVELLGYDIDQAAALPRGQTITLTLYWKLSRRLHGHWKLSTDVFDAHGSKLVNLNAASPLRAGPRGHPRLPPSAWSPGKFYVDELKFVLPTNSPARRVDVVAGVYHDSAHVMDVTHGDTDHEGRALIGSFAVAVENPGVTVAQLEPGASITVDGRLDEPAWRTSTVLGPFAEVEARPAPFAAPAGEDPLLRGEARMRWNSRGLYIGCTVHDEHVRADQPATAPGAAHDAFVLVVDPDGDGESDYRLEIGPKNAQVATKAAGEQPTERHDGGAHDAPWRSGAVSAVSVDGTLDRDDDKDEGYVVELMIPWKSFADDNPSPPRPGDTWKMNLYAVEKGASVGWAPSFAKDDYLRSPRLGTVVFASADGSIP